MIASQYHITQFLHYMSENLRLDVDYMDSMVNCKGIVFLKKLVEGRGIVIMN